jgi:hypothetical protein
VTSSSDSARNVRLHVDRCRACLFVEQLLFQWVGNGGIHSDDIGMHSSRKPLDKGLRPKPVGRKGLLSGLDPGRHNPNTGYETGCQSSCDTKAYDARGTVLNRRLERSGKVRPLSADDGHAKA